MNIYDFKNVSLAYEKKEILSDVNFSVRHQEFIGILGPNGCGKTTLLKLMTGVLKPTQGAIDLMEQPLPSYRRTDIAKIVSVLPQDNFLDFPFSALEVVLMGRAPYLKRFQWEGPKDRAIAEECMKLTDCWQLAHQDVRLLSGGERERVLLARALAQEPQVLLLDEPTTHVDLKHQAEIYHLLKDLNQNRNLTLVVVLHDLNFASLACHRILLLADKKLKGDGSPEQVLTSEKIKEVYGAEVFREQNQKSGKPFFLPMLS